MKFDSNALCRAPGPGTTHHRRISDSYHNYLDVIKLSTKVDKQTVGGRYVYDNVNFRLLSLDIYYPKKGSVVLGLGARVCEHPFVTRTQSQRRVQVERLFSGGKTNARLKGIAPS